MTWNKKEMTPEEQREAAKLEAQRRNISSTYRCGPRTGNRKGLRVAECVTTVMPGYSLEDAENGTGGPADE